MGGNYNKNYASYLFIKRISPTSQEVWTKEYGTPTDYEFMTSFIKLDDSTFVAGVGKSPIYIGQDDWTRSRIFAIAPKLGLVKWDWLGPLNEEASVHGLHQTPDKGWIYLTQTYEPNPIPDPVETWVAHIKVVRRDSAFNLLWERTLSPTASYWNSVGDLEATPDGNWVATGWWLSETYKTCFYKISDQGDSLWCTCLTPPDNTEGVVEPGGVVVLPSGSAVCVARYDKYVPSPAKTYGWLIKVDNDGCVDTLCELSAVFSPLAQSSVKVYPNPAVSYVKILFDSYFPRQTTWTVFDAFGRSVRNGNIGLEVNSLEIDLAGLPNGLYFWEVRAPNGQSWSGKFVKQNE
jgi:hypothetical protein